MTCGCAPTSPIVVAIIIAGAAAGLLMLIVSFLNSRDVSVADETVADIDPYLRKKRRINDTYELSQLHSRISALEDKVRDEVLDALPIRTKRVEFIKFKGFIDSLRLEVGNLTRVYNTLIEEVNALKSTVESNKEKDKK